MSDWEERLHEALKGSQRRIAELKKQMAQIEAERNGASHIVTELVALIPLRDMLPAARTGASLIAYYRELFKRAEEAEAKLKELELARQYEYTCPVCKTHDPDGYQRCQRAGCPDGRKSDVGLRTLQNHAKALRRRISELRIDHPEAADARRDELAKVEAEINYLRGLEAQEQS